MYLAKKEQFNFKNILKHNLASNYCAIALVLKLWSIYAKKLLKIFNDKTAHEIWVKLTLGLQTFYIFFV